MAEEYGKIRKSLMVGIADAIRAKKETTALFSPEQMAAEIESLAMGNDLPNAEDASFGTPGAGDEEYGITSWTSTYYSAGGMGNKGWTFEVVETCSLLGLRLWRWNSNYVKLWDSSGKLLATLSITSNGDIAWNSAYLENRINLMAGERYTVTAYCDGYQRPFTAISFNPKIKIIQGVFKQGYNTQNQFPTSVQPDAIYNDVDIIIGAPLIGSEVTEYKIQTETLTDIADEIRRISGATGSITTAQMITSLQGIATPSTE